MCRPRRHIARRLRLSNHLGSLTRSSGSDLARVVWYLAEHDLRIRLSHVHSFYDEDLHGQEQHFLLMWELAERFSLGNWLSSLGNWLSALLIRELAERADICCSGMADAPADYEENPPLARKSERYVARAACGCERIPSRP